jgi:prepilin-type N-terminal cleavage/methylation domain-containing protein
MFDISYYTNIINSKEVQLMIDSYESVFLIVSALFFLIGIILVVRQRGLLKEAKRRVDDFLTDTNLARPRKFLERWNEIEKIFNQKRFRRAIIESNQLTLQILNRFGYDGKDLYNLIIDNQISEKILPNIDNIKEMIDLEKDTNYVISEEKGGSIFCLYKDTLMQLGIIDEKNRAFTLIEILATISIIVLLSSIVVIGINDYKEDAQLKEVIAFSQELDSRLGDSLVAYWNFDEDSSDASVYDHGRFGYTLTPTNTTRQATGCLSGSCLQFIDASNSYIAGSSLGNKTFKSFCLWIKTTDTAADYILTKRSSATEQDGGLDLYLSSGYPGIRAYSADGVSVAALSNVAINDNDWHLVCASISDTPTLNIYVDGQRTGSISSVADNFGGTHNIYFGGYDATTANADFWIDNLMIFEDSIE